ncbi:MAG: thioredoxin family protein [Desulfovibrionales bacterium]|nr:thioredoxin family protein [Desulfovibrionales bacterium]
MNWKYTSLLWDVHADLPLPDSTKGLPAIFINDKLVVQGRYPSLSEMEELLYNG